MEVEAVSALQHHCLTRPDPCGAEKEGLADAMTTWPTSRTRCACIGCVGTSEQDNVEVMSERPLEYQDSGLAGESVPSMLKLSHNLRLGFGASGLGPRVGFRGH